MRTRSGQGAASENASARPRRHGGEDGGRVRQRPPGPTVRRLVVLAVVAVVGLAAWLCTFVVDADELAVVTQFGDPVRALRTPGLYFKAPPPIQSVTAYDARLFVLVPPPAEFLTREKKSIVASGFIVWRIGDPRKFMQTVFHKTGAESRLGDLLLAEIGAALGGAPFTAFVSTAPGEYRAEEILATVTRQYRDIAARDYGIEVVDVRLRRLDFPERNRQSVFARMKSERMGISMKLRSEGEEEGLKIRAAAEKTKSGILGEAFKLSQKLRGEGDAQAAKIYADTVIRAPDFYRFVRSLDAAKKSIDKDTTLVLPIDTDTFRLLHDSRFRYPEP
jgi:membrane protease subunit HflC